MKKQILIAAMALTTLAACQSDVNPLLVENAVLYSYDGEREKTSTMELTDEEIWKLCMLYNLSFPTNKDYLGCPIECDRIETKFKSGTELIIHSYRDEQWFIIQPGGYVFDNQLLLDYIQEVLEKHGLPLW